MAGRSSVLPGSLLSSITETKYFIWIISCAWGSACRSEPLALALGGFGPPCSVDEERPHLDLPVADLRSLGGELERHVQVGGLDDPEAGEMLLRLHERPVGEHRLLASVIDDRGRTGVCQPAGEDPVALRDQPVVEDADGRPLFRAA